MCDYRSEWKKEAERLEQAREQLRRAGKRPNRGVPTGSAKPQQARPAPH